MTRIVIFADEVNDRRGLLSRLRDITGEPLGEINYHVEHREPVIDLDMYEQSGYLEKVDRLRRVLNELDDDIAKLTIFEIPRLTSWRDHEVLKRYAIDRQVLANILDSDERDRETM